MALAGMLVASSLIAQNTAPAPTAPATTLRITSRAVVVDVTVTDRNGKPVTGLKREAFSVSEQGKPQTISYFEEHNGAEEAKQDQKAVFPVMPPDVFTNFSPIKPPPAVNVLLLDSLNTYPEDQMSVHEQVKNYLKTLKPGSRIAIFVMGMRLSFVQGFADDPALLAAALGYKKNALPEPTPLMPSSEEIHAEEQVLGMMSAPAGSGSGQGTSAPIGMIQALSQFLTEGHYAQASDREHRTLQNLQQLATFLGGFPGRKNLVWLSGTFPLALFGQTEMRFEADVKKTINLLNAARVSIYPIDAHGVQGNTLFTANNQLNPEDQSASAMLGSPGIVTCQTESVTCGAGSVTSDSSNNGGGVFTGSFSDTQMGEMRDINFSHSTMDMLARETGGQAFHDKNRLSDAIGKAVEASASFYTLAYTPTDQNMDGAFRKIDVQANGTEYTLSFRHGYYALDQDLPGAAKTTEQQAAKIQSNQDPAMVDPLMASMEFGMPQTQQILYKALIQPIPEKPDAAPASKPSGKGPFTRYSVDFAVNASDLKLKLDSDGDRVGTMNVSLIAYDKHGAVAARGDYIGQMKIKPDAYKAFQLAGVQIHEEIEIPKGQFWLRTGLYDQATHKVGTMEIPLSSVKPLEVAAK
jgi:VWFA-related protein